MRKLSKLAAVVAVAALFTIGAVAPANASQPDFAPSGSKFREYMLNLTSSVLKGAMPSGWKAEQLANQYRYNHSWEALNAQFGYDTANPNYMGAPDSYNDYILKRHDQDMQGGRGGKPFRAPATKPSLWQKTVTGVGGLASLTMFPVGAALGTAGIDMIGSWFGFNAQGAVCGQGDGWGKTTAEIITGRDCSMFTPDLAYLESLVGLKAKCVSVLKSDKAWCNLPLGVEVTYFPEGITRLSLCMVEYEPAKETVPDLSAVTGGRWIYEFNSGRTLRTRGAVWSDPQWGQSSNIPHCKPAVVHQSFQSDNVNDNPDKLSAEQFGLIGQLIDFYPVDTSGKRVPTTDVDVPGMEQGEDRVLECEITLDDGSVIRSKGANYGKDVKTLPAPECPNVPEGRVAKDVEIREKKPADPPGTGTSVSKESTTPEYQDWATKFPECGTGACKLDLIQKPKASCFDLEYACENWFEDAQREQKYECRYGVKTVELKECYVYSGLFKPGRVDTSSPYTDPETGIWSGGRNSPGEDRDAFGLNVQNPEATRECNKTNGSGGFDPIRFIMRPVQCALEWAFVPREAVVKAELAGGDKAWEKKPPKVIATAVSGFALTPAVSGCSRPMTMFAGGMFEMQVEAWNFCPGTPGAMIAAASRLATTAAMVALVVIVVRRQIAGMVGYGAGQ